MEGKYVAPQDILTYEPGNMRTRMAKLLNSSFCSAFFTFDKDQQGYWHSLAATSRTGGLAESPCYGHWGLNHNTIFYNKSEHKGEVSEINQTRLYKIESWKLIKIVNNKIMIIFP